MYTSEVNNMADKLDNNKPANLFRWQQPKIIPEVVKHGKYRVNFLIDNIV